MLCLRARGDLGDLAGDGALPHMVVAHLQLVQDLLRVAVCRVHCGHAGVLLAAEAVHERAVNVARKIAGDDVAEYLADGGREFKGGVLLLLLRGGELRAVEGQQPRCLHLRLHAFAEVGVDDKDLFQIPRVVRLQKDVGDLPRAVQRGVLRRVQKAAADGDAVPETVLPPVFADDEKFHVAAVLLGEGVRRLDDVLVIRARQPLVRGHDEAPDASFERLFSLRGVEIAVFDLGVRPEDALDLRLYGVEVGARALQIFARLPQLCRGDQVHGVGDLLRAPYARHAGAELLHRHLRFLPAARKILLQKL